MWGHTRFQADGSEGSRTKVLLGKHGSPWEPWSYCPKNSTLTHARMAWCTCMGRCAGNVPHLRVLPGRWGIQIGKQLLPKIEASSRMRYESELWAEGESPPTFCPHPSRPYTNALLLQSPSVPPLQPRVCQGLDTSPAEISHFLPGHRIVCREVVLHSRHCAVHTRHAVTHTLWPPL